MIIAPEREPLLSAYNLSLRTKYRSSGYAFLMNELHDIAQTVRRAANPFYENTIIRLEPCRGERWYGCGIGSGYSVHGTHELRRFGPLDFSAYEQVYFIGHEPMKGEETCLRNRDHIEQVISELTPDEVRQILPGLRRFTSYDIREKPAFGGLNPAIKNDGRIVMPWDSGAHWPSRR